ncbi:Adaptive-response sensory-kinase SasA [Halomicronema hongdechloris C2206]|uniref:Adaptive-response sensory-kinase SasA n=1 Tax=Halomicronema hongdechloris C2206 TaxID=1641165 RepID=A0A1Z3HNK6_9CYAN|nr:histidine kinase [Halomicronema hongdechloris]ASC71871.1 Adaptive-response sensory-kinase SasA [Halomicronema hongdechloris C2206]
MEATSQASQASKVPLKLLLFIDKRPSSSDHVRQIRQYLKSLEEHFHINLDVVDVGEHPYLAEHYRLVASPALIKIAPLPQRTLTGSDIVPQLQHWWPRWHQNAQAQVAPAADGASGDELVFYDPNDSIAHSAELMKLSDDIFRLNQVKEELEAQLRFKNRIIAMMAHDLRNPLTAASIAVETLEMGYGHQQEGTTKLSPELTNQLLKHVKTQIRAIDRMITDILQTARGASAELQIQPQDMDLKALCFDVLGAMKNRIREKQQRVQIDIPQDLPHVYADGSQIRRVILNLLDNAIKYTPLKGTVEVMALHRTNQKVQVTIHDSGPGIPEENRDNIFEERFRLQRDESQDGYGLGLALCQRILRAHYGQIWVDSVVNEGSYFHFTLPVYRA